MLIRYEVKYLIGFHKISKLLNKDILISPFILFYNKKVTWILDNPSSNNQVYLLHRSILPTSLPIVPTLLTNSTSYCIIILTVYSLLIGRSIVRRNRASTEDPSVASPLRQSVCRLSDRSSDRVISHCGHSRDLRWFIFHCSRSQPTG